MLDLTNFKIETLKTKGSRPGAIGRFAGDDKLWMIKFEVNPLSPAGTFTHYQGQGIDTSDTPDIAIIHEYFSTQIIRDIIGADFALDVRIASNPSEELLANIHPALKKHKPLLALASPYICDSISLQDLKATNQDNITQPDLKNQLQQIYFLCDLLDIADYKEEHILLNSNTNHFFIIDNQALFNHKKIYLFKNLFAFPELRKKNLSLMKKFSKYDDKKIRLNIKNNCKNLYENEIFKSLIKRLECTQEKTLRLINNINKHKFSYNTIIAASPHILDSWQEIKTLQTFLNHSKKIVFNLDYPYPNLVGSGNLINYEKHKFKNQSPQKEKKLSSINIHLLWSYYPIQPLSAITTLKYSNRKTEHLGYLFTAQKLDFNMTFKSFTESIINNLRCSSAINEPTYSNSAWNNLDYATEITTEYEFIRNNLCQKAYALLMQDLATTFNIIDAGTGFGQTLESFYNNLPEALRTKTMKFMGFDLNEINIGRAKEKHANNPFNFYVWDALAIQDFLKKILPLDTKKANKTMILAAGLLTSMVLPNSYTAAKVLQESYDQADYWVLSGTRPVYIRSWMAKAMGYNFQNQGYISKRPENKSHVYTVVSLTKMPIYDYLSRFKVINGYLNFVLCPIPLQIAKSLPANTREQVTTLDLSLIRASSIEEVYTVISFFINCKTIIISGKENFALNLSNMNELKNNLTIQIEKNLYFEYPDQSGDIAGELRLLSPKTLQQFRDLHPTQKLLPTIGYFFTQKHEKNNSHYDTSSRLTCF